MSYKISVALCTYNGKYFIEDQIDSILNQTIMPDELIICDDRSTDETVELVKKKMEKSNIKYQIIVNDQNLGLIKNFENAIRKCTGDIIFTADQDDIWLNEKVEFVVNKFKSNKELSLVYTDAYLVDEDLTKFGINLWDTLNSDMEILRDRQALLKVLLKNNLMTGATMAFKRSTIGNSLPFNKWWIHDYWIAVTGTLIGEVEAISKPLILYRQHENNVIGASKLGVISKVKKYIDNFKNLQSIRDNKYNMMTELSRFVYVNKDDISYDDKMLVKRAYLFWQELSSLNEKKRNESIFIIIANYLKGNYSIFYTGIRGAFRDIINVLIL